MNFIQILVEIVRSELCKKVENMTFEKLLETKSNDLKLLVMDKSYEIVYNFPWVLNLTLPTNILAGFRVYPSKVELQFANRKHSIGKWYKAKKVIFVS